MSDDDDDNAMGAFASDPRVAWLFMRIGNTLKCKPDKLLSMKKDEVAGSNIQTFLEDADEKRLLIFIDGKGDYMASKDPPDAYKKNTKAMFFLKTKEAPVDMACTNDVICGDFFAKDLRGQGNPLEYFDALSHDVFLPLVSSSSIVGSWPDTLTKEVMGQLHKMLANMHRTIGESHGTTQLPLPPTETSSLMDEKEKNYQLETSIVDWAHQIKSILKLDPESELKAGNHVGPAIEIEFWRHKAKNLNAIHEQLTGSRMQKIIEVLEESKSTYVPSFLRLCEDVSVAMTEANDNVKFLNTLEAHLDRLAMGDEFIELANVFGLVMHTIMFIWKHSKFYRTPARLVVLMREICNDLIRQAEKFLEPDTILEDEPQDAVDKLKTALRVCSMMKTVYFGYKARVAVECPDNPWRFQNSALFVRLDSFLERCHDILELTNTVLQFSKLETVEVGGTKGKILTTSVAQIFNDFSKSVSRFHQIDYSLLDVEADKFDDDFYLFRGQIKELERRLGSVITQGFDDCPTVYTAFKLLDSFDAMLEREVIVQDLEKKHIDLVQRFGTDLRDVLEIFKTMKDHPMIGRNMPPVAGAVLWIRGLKERIRDPFDRFKTIHASTVMDTEETKEIFKLYAQTMTMFEEFETKQFGQWCEAIESVGQDKLKQPLLLRYTDGGFDGRGKGLPLLRVNFDPALTKLLREVKYLKLLNLEVPETADSIFSLNETFRQQMGNLDLLTQTYNLILFTLKDVEKPMLQTKMDKIDEEIKKGLTALTWKSHGINDFISSTMGLVKETHSILTNINSNVAQILKILGQMEANVMVHRKDGKTYALEDYQSGHETVIGNRHNDVLDGSDDIHALLLKSNKVLRISKGAASWKAYQDYIAGIVVEGLSVAVQASMQAMMNQLDEVYMQKNELSALLEVRLELLEKNPGQFDILYTPSIDPLDDNCELRDCVMGWTKDFMNVAKFVARLDTQEGDYLYEMEEDPQLVFLTQELNILLNRVEIACQAFAAGYRKYEYLWHKDIATSFAEVRRAERCFSTNSLLYSFVRSDFVPS